MDSYVLCGMQFGDEGKGTFVDYLTYEKNADCIVRYNGGSQASHTVITPSGILHKFSQLGSGMFKGKCNTYLTENMVVNLYNLMCEIEVFSKSTGIPIKDIVDRIHIHENCYIVTPYHKLINRLRELTMENSRRGSVGTGVSEVNYLLYESENDAIKLGIRVRDVYKNHGSRIVLEKFRKLQEYANNLYIKNKEKILKNIPLEIKSSLENEINVLLNENAYLVLGKKYVKGLKYANSDINFKRCIYSCYNMIEEKNKTAIFEGSQGLLIDGFYGIKPNTTFLDTTNKFFSNISFKGNVRKIGVVKAFCSRHGPGIFPTESADLMARIDDKNQDFSFWNGKIRFGWFDAILLRYAQSINNVDELFLSSLDILGDFDKIKICNKYLYTGIVDYEFKNIFEFYTSAKDEVIVTNIKQNGKNISTYLKYCIPIYIDIDGWKTDISKATKISDLPIQCTEYIKLLQNLTNIKISVISVGPTRNNKIVIGNI